MITYERSPGLSGASSFVLIIVGVEINLPHSAISVLVPTTFKKVVVGTQPVKCGAPFDLAVNFHSQFVMTCASFSSFVDGGRAVLRAIGNDNRAVVNPYFALVGF